MAMFAGERALVTGAAASIGRGIAIALAREGAHVLLADINAVGNAETKRLIETAGGSARAIEADLSQPDGHRTLLAACANDLPLHMFVHAASPPRHEHDGVRTVSEATWDAMVDDQHPRRFLSRPRDRPWHGERQNPRPAFVPDVAAR